MAIAFARIEYISRKSGGNIVRTAAYNARENLILENGRRFAFKGISPPEHHEIRLPASADGRFRDPAVLWNEVEKAEKRKDSQLARELVLALPANPEITRDDRIELTRSFVDRHFVYKGLPAQIDLHVPDHAGFGWERVNYHAHVLSPMRRLEGDHLADGKARDLDPKVWLIRGRPIGDDNRHWGQMWRDHQNAFFREHGIAITVDPNSAVPGKHLGPIRFRNRESEEAQIPVPYYDDYWVLVKVPPAATKQ